MLTFKDYLIESSSSGSNRARTEVEQAAAQQIFDQAMQLAYDEAGDQGGGVTHNRIAAIAAQLVHNEGARMSQSILDIVNQMIEDDFRKSAQ